MKIKLCSAEMATDDVETALYIVLLPKLRRVVILEYNYDVVTGDVWAGGKVVKLKAPALVGEVEDAIEGLLREIYKPKEMHWGGCISKETGASEEEILERAREFIRVAEFFRGLLI